MAYRVSALRLQGSSASEATKWGRHPKLTQERRNPPYTLKD